MRRFRRLLSSLSVLFLMGTFQACQFEKRQELTSEPPVVAPQTPHAEEPAAPPASLGFEHGTSTPANDETQPTTQPTPETTPSTQPAEGASGF